MIAYPKQLNLIFNTLKSHHIKPIIVGGYVRDFFLGIDSKDIDIELYNVESLEKVEKILEEFGDVNSVGKSFGVCKLLYNGLDLDFSLPRSDSKTAEGHKGFHITVDTSLDFTKAAKRRDFTMNAIGYNPLTQEILDPYNGYKDLHNRYLKAVNLQTFGEDPLRVLRAVSFYARFHLHIDKHLLKLLKSMIQKNALQELPRERIFEEIKKILLKAPKPSRAFFLLQKLGAWHFFSEFSHLHEDERSEMFYTLDNIQPYLRDFDEESRLSLLLSLLCRKFSPTERFSFLNKLTRNKKLTESVIKFSEISFDLNTLTNYTVYKLANKINIKLLLPLLFVLYPKKKESIYFLEQKAKELGVLEKRKEALLQGSDLINAGLQPSKEFGLLLQEAYELQMQEKITTKNEALQWLNRRVILS